LPGLGQLKWKDYKVLYEVNGFGNFKDPNQLTVSECRQLMEAVRNGTIQFLQCGVQAPQSLVFAFLILYQVA
jgi:hypothetical protein